MTPHQHFAIELLEYEISNVLSMQIAGGARLRRKRPRPEGGNDAAEDLFVLTLLRVYFSGLVPLENLISALLNALWANDNQPVDICVSLNQLAA